MMDLKTYGYTEIEAIPDGLLPGRVTELRRERFTVMTERGEVTAVLKGAFYYSAETRVDFPCVGDFVLLHYNENGDSLQDKTSYLIDKRARNKTIALWSKQTKKNGGWKK